MQKHLQDAETPAWFVVKQEGTFMHICIVQKYLKSIYACNNGKRENFQTQHEELVACSFLVAADDLFCIKK